MLKIKIDHVIGVNGLLEFSRDEKSGLSLWEDVGNNVWTWEQILESAELVTKEDLLEGMKNADGELCESAVLEVLPQDGWFDQKVWDNLPCPPPFPSFN